MTQNDQVILYQVLKGLGEEGTLISNVFADRRVTGPEAFQLIASAPNLMVVIGNGTEAIKAYKNATGEEKEAAAAYLGAALNIGGPELDAKIDKTLLILARIQVNFAEIWGDIASFRVLWAV